MDGFTLDNGVRVESAYTNKGIWIETGTFLVFIPMSKLALIAQREHDMVHNAVHS